MLLNLISSKTGEPVIFNKLYTIPDGHLNANLPIRIFANSEFR